MNGQLITPKDRVDYDLVTTKGNQSSTMRGKKRMAVLLCISIIFNQMWVKALDIPFFGDVNKLPLVKEAKEGIDDIRNIIAGNADDDDDKQFDVDMEAAFDQMSREGTNEFFDEMHSKKDEEHLHRKRDAPATISETSKILQQKLESFKGTASKAKAGINNLVKAYDSASSDTKDNINNVLSTTVSSLDKFVNAESNPIGAVQATLDIVSSMAAFVEPAGAVISMGLSFISGILGLFGQAPEAEKPIGDVVREQIEKALAKFYDQTLKNEAEGCIEAFQHSKAFLDGVASAVDGQVPDNAVSSLSAHVPVYHGLTFMGKLASSIRDVIRKDSPKEGEKCMRYIELYAKLATLKNMILLQLAALIPDSQSAIRAGVLGVRNSLSSTSRTMLRFLYSHKLKYVNTVSYFDPYRYPITDGYMMKILKLEAPDRSMYGVYSIRNLLPGSYYHDYLSFDTESPHPVVTVEKNDPNDWLLIPRGNRLFTIASLWGCHKSYEFCRGILSWDDGDTHPTCTIENDDPMYWYLVRKSVVGYKLLNTWKCPDNKWCTAELSYDGRSGTYPIATVQFDDPCVWEVTRLRDYTP
ncbi:uncharacterized protein LOC122797775 [Protopterus annectens]|uniref:uncharacterized protein LOC122797775 n=1 Tax=Protopterus annectens TaxID=7888 RepID=UPI001CFB6E79|nr:uncharacterized protein LOC122797775 [Protopterus annectens]